MKTLIIDGQMWQTNAYFRGMGGYAFGLLSALLEANDDINLHIVLNENMTHDEPRLDGIKSWLPSATLHLLDLPYEPKPGAEESRAVAVLDQFVESLGTTHSETFYFIPALFLFQYCAVFPTHVGKILLFHDLMPLIYREELGKYFPAHIYFPRFRTIFEADLVVTNSQTTASDLLAYTGLDDERVVNIDGSLNERLVHDDNALKSAESVLDRLGLRNKPYVIMPTGGLENKNNVRATEAFRLICDAGDTETQLVVTSFFDELAKQELRLIAGDRITFTGNIENEELLALYTNCKVLLMPSLYEGLGLPVLEGVAHTKPVACSGVPVFKEIPYFEEALYGFDPFDVESIANALDDALHQVGFAAKQKLFPKILEKYSWKRSAGIFAKALQQATYFTKQRPKPTKKIAIVCPDPRKNTDVAVFAQRMYGFALRANIEPVYFIDPGGDDEPGVTVHPDYIRSLALCYDIDDIYAKLRDMRFDNVVHFVKADVRFAKLLRVAMSVPGLVYISDNGYEPVIEELAEKGMVSKSQADAERVYMQLANKDKAFGLPSLLAGAKGVIVEKPQVPAVKRAMDAFELRLPQLTVEPSEYVNNGADVGRKQQKAYATLLAFIKGEK